MHSRPCGEIPVPCARHRIMPRAVSLLILSLFFFPFVCSAGGRLQAAKTPVVFWTTEVEQDRLDLQKRLAEIFTAEQGLQVKVVPVQENRLAERVIAAYAAKALPDVIFHPLEFAVGWAEAGILDSGAATRVIRHLGEKTFAKGPLNLAKVRDGYAAVPTDGWGQLLLYRRDLFAQKGLPPPTDWKGILVAARVLHHPPAIWGFEAATDPGAVYTQQVFEHFALSGGVKLTDARGRVNLDTPAMARTLGFYRRVARYSPPGNLNWLHTRMDYLSGRAAMIVWSPFILDELSGLRKDQPIIPDLKRKSPGFLARNTGLVAVIRGPSALAQYGQVNYLGITRDADSWTASLWVSFLLGKGYLRWLSMAPEGKLPVRKGTLSEPNRFVDGWSRLKIGIADRASISDVYGKERAASIIRGTERMDRWGFSEGKGSLVAKIYRTKVVPRILKRFLDGEMDAARAARLMTERIRALE